MPIGQLHRQIRQLTSIVKYQTVCDSDIFQRVIQTWTNSKAGLLSSVTVNLAAGGQADGVQVVVFRFTNLADLVSPS